MVVLLLHQEWDILAISSYMPIWAYISLIMMCKDIWNDSIPTLALFSVFLLSYLRYFVPWSRRYSVFVYMVWRMYWYGRMYIHRCSTNHSIHCCQCGTKVSSPKGENPERNSTKRWKLSETGKEPTIKVVDITGALVLRETRGENQWYPNPRMTL